MMIKITSHAICKMYEEGITEDMIREAIQKGARFKQTDGCLAVYRYYSVAFKVIGKEAYKIKTVFLNR